MPPVLASHEQRASDLSYASPWHTDMCNLRIYTEGRHERQKWNRELARRVLHHELMLRKLEFLYISHERLLLRASYSVYLFQMSCDCFGLNCIFARGAYQYFVRGKVLKELLWQRSRTRWRRYCRHGDGGQYLEDVQLGSVG